MNKKHSMFHRLLLILTFTAMLICLTFVMAVFGGGTISNLRNSSFGLFDQHIQFRTSDLNEIMSSELYETQTYAALESICEKTYNQRQRYTGQDVLPADILNELNNITKNKYISGSFVIFDKSAFQSQTYPAYYLTDANPTDTFNDKSDIIARYGNPATLKKNGFPLHSDWRSSLVMNEKDDLYQFYFRPFQAALKTPGEEEQSYAYWGDAISMKDYESEFITYSFPLIHDGKPYGVIGIEIAVDFLKKYLPYSELSDGMANAYVLAKCKAGSDTYTVMLSNGPAYQHVFTSGSSFRLKDEDKEDSGEMQIKDQTVLVEKKQLQLYKTNTPFADEEWYVLGIVDKDQLYIHAKELENNTLYTMFLTLLLAFFIALLTSMRFSRPIAHLTTVLKTIDPNEKMLLPRVHINEIDELASSIEGLSHTLSIAESRLSQVVHALGMPLGAIEIYDNNTVYCTEEVPKLLHFQDLTRTSYTKDDFLQMMHEFQLKISLYEKKEERQQDRWIHTYVISYPQASQTQWLRFIVSDKNGSRVIIVMDVSEEIQTKQKLTYERDHDVLTQLLNRRAFKSQVEHVMQNENCGICAMVLWDLDNLKIINDTYGHDAGDRLICATAAILQKLSSARCIVSRMAGDEFLIFFHNYQSPSEIKQQLETIHEEINTSTVSFSNHEESRIRISAGIAWYPKDATDFVTLSKYADFAMYDIKSTQKGGIREFDQHVYHKDKLLLNGRNELNEILDKNLVSYAYQPIVKIQDGSLFGFEALMRPKGSIITSPNDIMRLARSQSQLYRVEYMTWTQAMHQFDLLHTAFPQCRLFINSIPNVPLLDDLSQVLEKQFSDILGQLVIEIIETDEIEQHYLETKQQFVKKWNAAIAIDDFGSGYNNESLLLNTKANFLKIDMMFIRDIHLDENRQHLVSNIIEFAHEHHIEVIAEGVEVREELLQLIKMQVDYVQGYYLGKPAMELSTIYSDKIKQEVLHCHRLLKQENK